jgi:hypothetical protein
MLPGELVRAPTKPQTRTIRYSSTKPTTALMQQNSTLLQMLRLMLPALHLALGLLDLAWLAAFLACSLATFCAFIKSLCSCRRCSLLVLPALGAGSCTAGWATLLLLLLLLLLWTLSAVAATRAACVHTVGG